MGVPFSEGSHCETLLTNDLYRTQAKLLVLIKNDKYVDVLMVCDIEMEIMLLRGVL